MKHVLQCHYSISHHLKIFEIEIKLVLLLYFAKDNTSRFGCVIQVLPSDMKYFKFSFICYFFYNYLFPLFSDITFDFCNLHGLFIRLFAQHFVAQMFLYNSLCQTQKLITYYHFTQKKLSFRKNLLNFSKQLFLYLFCFA